ncbi:hypothetical protein SAMN04488511_10451 [Pedobacter suwonensis]|uniref:Yip1 domain-containing protein n=1 Tax=Pedobacter suwonensis TaxID=332999 RepID=A0A1I0SXE0_9SPHI|nr:hypothetical protein [Pedobacter suwonensis]SFA44194.1 hypothetical protein SAMN04488511_10451 [Pedobacter suwonensis]
MYHWLNKKVNNYILLVFVVLSTSAAFVWTSNEAGNLQKMISGSDNGYFKVLSNVNNVISFFIPIILLAFFNLTSRIVASILDLKLDLENLNLSIAYAFIPVLISVAAYSILLSNLDTGLLSEGASLSQLSEIYLFGKFTMRDYTYVGYVSWVLFFIIYSFNVNKRCEVELYKAFIICCTPTIIVLLIRALFA